MALLQCGEVIGEGPYYNATVYLINNAGDAVAMDGEALLADANENELEPDGWYLALRMETSEGSPVYRTMGTGSPPGELTVSDGTTDVTAVETLTFTEDEFIVTDEGDGEASVELGIVPVVKGGTGLDEEPDDYELLMGWDGGYMLGTLVAGSGVVITTTGNTIRIAATTGGAGSGTVTSVGLALPSGVFSVTGSPVTTSGTLTGSFTNQGATTFFAGPTSGASAAPTFRTILPGDIPGLDTAKLTSGILPAVRGGTDNDDTDIDDGTLLIGNGTTGEYEVNTLDAGTGIVITNDEGAIEIARTRDVTSVALTMPTGFTVTNSPITTSGTIAVSTSLTGILKGTGTGLTTGTPGTDYGLGTVTSVAATLPAATYSISGSPITTSGTIVATYTTQTSGTALMGPTSGSAATPTWRRFDAQDIPDLDASKITTGTFPSARLPGTAFSVLLAQVSSVTVANTVTPTTLLATSPAFTSSTIGAGTTFKCTAGGLVSTFTTGQTFTIIWKMGTIALGQIIYIMGGGTGTNMPWEASFTCTIRTTGAPGTAGSCGSGHVAQLAFGAVATTPAPTTSGNPALDVQVIWGVANAGNTITCTACVVEQLA